MVKNLKLNRICSKLIYKDFFHWQTQAYIELKRIDNENEGIDVKKIKNDGFDPVMHHPIVTCYDYGSLIKILGVLNSYFSNHDIEILYRGQTKPYDFMQYPTIYRNNEEAISVLFEKKRFEAYYAFYLETLRLTYEMAFVNSNSIHSFFKSVKNPLVWEATLRHYGWAGRFIDLVSDVPIALWFTKFSYDERNNKTIRSEEPFGYLFVYGIHKNEKISPGIYQGKYQRLINLREAIPPSALRPHNQHAYLMSSLDLLNLDISFKELKPDEFKFASNFNEYVLCVIKIPKNVLDTWFNIDSDQKSYLRSFQDYEFLFPNEDRDEFLKQLKDFIEYAFNNIGSESEDIANHILEIGYQWIKGFKVDTLDDL